MEIDNERKLYYPFIDDMKDVDLKINRYYIASRLHSIRKMNHMTQEDVSAISGLSIATISRIENGENVLIDNIAKYARSCGYELTVRKIDIKND